MNGGNKERFDQAISRLQHALDDTNAIREVVVEYLQEIAQPINAMIQELDRLKSEIIKKEAVIDDLDQKIKERQSELEWSGSKREYVIRQLRAAIQTASEKPFRSGLRYQRNPYARQIEAVFTRAVNRRIDDLLAISRVRSSNDEIQEHSRIAEESRQKLADELRAARKRLRELKNMESRHPNSFASVPPPLLDADQIVRNGTAVPSESGIYFLWEGSQVAYVGQSINLARRLLNHPQLQPGDKISYLCMDASELFYHESFYIGLCRPSRNGYQKVSKNGSQLVRGNPSPDRYR